jgi:hypothetical protein
MNYVNQGMDVILTNSAHTLIAGGFAPLPRTTDLSGESA